MKINKTIKINTRFRGMSEENNFKLSNQSMHITEFMYVQGEISYSNYESELIKNVENLCEKGEKLFDPKVHKTYYRFPGINLSRDKMDNVKQKYGTAKVLDYKKADAYIIGKSFIKKCLEPYWRLGSVSLSSFIAYLTKNKDNFEEGVYESCMKQIDYLTVELNLESDDEVIVNTERSY